MPATQYEASLWCFQGFFAVGQNGFWRDEPRDWERLQVWDGSTLQPAMPQNFSGMPSQEQMDMLYNYAKNGQLFLFELGSNSPRMLGATEHPQIRLDGQAPAAPVDPGEEAGAREKAEYRSELEKYNSRLEQFNRGQEVLQGLGENFVNAANAFNAGRDMKWENEEREIRAKDTLEVTIRNRNKADRVISEAFAPRPIASGNIYFSNGHAVRDAALHYSTFEQQMEPNGYDLPENSKLTNEEAATINLAMLGAKNYIEPLIQKNRPNIGPLRNSRSASDEFNMLITGMFGWSRIGQGMSQFFGAAMQRGKENIEAYLAGKPQQLGKDLADCVRNIRDGFTNISQNKFSREMVAATKLTERLMGLFEKDPQLLQATGLNDQELEFMRGYIQMGKVFDNYLNGRMKLASAEGHGQNLSLEERKEILADLVIRRLVERELVNENKNVEKGDEYQQKQMDAMMKDMAIEDAYKKWIKDENIDAIQDGVEKGNKIEQWRKKNDANENISALVVYPVDHDIIHKLGQPGFAERLRETLINDPLLAQKAQLDNFGITRTKDGKELLNSDELDALLGELNPSIFYMLGSDEQKLAWFNNMKAMLTAPAEGQDLNALSPWINAGVASDAGRLMIAVPNGEGGKELVSVASQLAGGISRLENPNADAIDLLYRHAKDGNLYYYQVGKDMPQRITGNGEQAAAQQLEEPVKPTIWQWIARIFTLGWAYRDIFHQPVDRDPAALDAIVANKANRATAITDEVARHGQIAADLANQANKEAPVNDGEQKENQQEQIEETVTRGLKPHTANGLLKYTKKSVPENTLGIDGNLYGVLVQLAMASPDLSIKVSQNERMKNDPDTFYGKVIEHCLDNMPIGKTRTGGFLGKAENSVKEAMALAGKGDFSKLGQIIAVGLTHNNKMLKGFNQLNDTFTAYASIGANVLGMLNGNANLKQAVVNALGGDTKQLTMANAAKNINQLRLDGLDIYEKMLNTFGATLEKTYTDPITQKKTVEYTNVVGGKIQDLAKVAQLFNVEVNMNAGQFNLETTEYANDKVVDTLVNELNRSNTLSNFLKSPDRLSKLADPMKMKNLYEDAVAEHRQLLSKQSGTEKTMVNENQLEQKQLEQKQLEQSKVP